MDDKVAARTLEERPLLQGKLAMVTGATAGIGMETALMLASLGATVVFAVRNQAKAERVAKDIRHRLGDRDGAAAELVLPGGSHGLPTVDFSSPASVRAFAHAFNGCELPLHILVNNAGVSQMPNIWHTDEQGVPGLAQINHLGPYLLTRLLEAKLVQYGTRVVNISSVTHRCLSIADPHAFLTRWMYSLYPHTKLANVLFAYQLQRFLGRQGVQSVAVDPGAVASDIWGHTTLVRHQPFRGVINALYAPPSDAAQIVVHAATVPWERDCRSGVEPQDDLRFYARGAFASPLVTHPSGAWTSWLNPVTPALFTASMLAHSFFDYPVRNLSGGKYLGTIAPVPSSPQSYDADLALALWDESARVAGVPLRPAVPSLPTAHAAGGRGAANGSSKKKE